MLLLFYFNFIIFLFKIFHRWLMHVERQLHSNWNWVVLISTPVIRHRFPSLDNISRRCRSLTVIEHLNGTIKKHLAVLDHHSPSLGVIDSPQKSIPVIWNSSLSLIIMNHQSVYRNSPQWTSFAASGRHLLSASLIHRRLAFVTVSNHQLPSVGILNQWTSLTAH